MFSYHKSIKLKFNNNKIFRKSQILRHQILANTTIILKIAKEIRKIKVRRRELYSIWLTLHGVLQQVKLTWSNRSQNKAFLEHRAERRLRAKWYTRGFGMMEIFYLDWGGSYMVYMFIKPSWAIHSNVWIKFYCL